MSSGYPQANAPPGDDIDEIIRMAEAGIRIPKKEFPPAASAAPASAPQQQTDTKPQAAAAVPDATTSTSEAAETVVPASTKAASEEKDKKSKKDKDKNNKMVYTDNEVSPEEKMAKMSRYQFASASDGKEDSTLVDANTVPGVAGVVDQ